MAAQIAGNDEWLAAVEVRAQHNLSLAAGLYSNTMAWVGLALIAVQRSDSASAEEQYNALAQVPGIMVFYIGTDQVLGLLSVALGRLDQAVAHFEDSLKFCRKAGYRPNLALTYDAFGLLFKAVQDEGKVDPDAIRDGLAAIIRFDGVTGSFNYDGVGGDPAKSAVLLQIKDGKFVFHSRVEPKARQLIEPYS